MAIGINKVILVGNLGHSPSVKESSSGTKIANLSLATSETWKDKQSGNTEEKTEWHKIVFFGKLAEISEKYLSKGMRIYIEGKLQTRKYKGKDGSEKSTTEIVGDKLLMLSGKSDTNESFDDSKDSKERNITESIKSWAQQDDDDVPF